MLAIGANVKTRLAVSLVSLMLALPCQAKIIYVDGDANGLNDGTIWRDAYKYLQDALADANSVDKPLEIWVAQGTYRPDEDTLHPGGTGNQEATFQLINDVAIKGGYAGPRMSLSGADPNERNTGLYITTLSGDLNSNDAQVKDPADLLNEFTRIDNSLHIVKGSGTDDTAVLDGFTITGGNAKWMKDQGLGGGMYNYIGSPTIINCTFKGNSARGGGGGMLNDHSSPIIIDCAFIENSEFNFGGGGVFNNMDCNATLINCTFIRNYALYGGGVGNWISNLTLIGCTFSSNVAIYGGGIRIHSGKLTVRECIISGNVATGTQFGGGGGISCECGIIATITDSVITGNKSMGYGGGIACLICGGSTTGQVRIDRCTVNENVSELSGGGIFSSYYITDITNSTISGNLARSGGGACYLYPSMTTLTNCAFVGNLSEDKGGGVYTCGPICTVNNCTFVQNSANLGGGMCILDRSNAAFRNCIIWANTAQNGLQIALKDKSGLSINYSDIQDSKGGIYDPCGGLSWGEGNIDADPCFASPGYRDPNGTPQDPNDDFWVDGDYHLKSKAGRWDENEGRWMKDEVTSLCIDAGDLHSPIGLEPFPNGGIINIGAYGGTAEASKSYFGEPVCETIVAGDINGDCIVNFKDFAIMALHWLQEH